MNRHSANFISAFDFDVIRQAFQRSIADDRIPPEEWEKCADDLVRYFVGSEVPREVVAALLNSVRQTKNPPAEADGL
ncbi:hypothetical protein P9273_08825 [Mesorhizobium sp. WSM4935]|uniref:hypothetical protein n=1 Tax=Mesorhizobium sp. WSM4935 TaxID=3038547 RepID=UPI0024150AD1|nr:hypothetical protein [Mesorhizobium sp. WSM4935]MDG4875199.1 hypothetical protein [Mesorhizobium sp. WSM4935]